MSAAYKNTRCYKFKDRLKTKKWVAILIPHQRNFNTRRHLIKGSIHQEDMRILNVFKIHEEISFNIHEGNAVKIEWRN